jgi:multidrug resistance efflux pump
MPMIEAGVSATLKLAADTISASLKYAQERTRNNVESLKAYADAARDAIIALEAEYDNILIDAEFCDLSSIEQNGLCTSVRYL